MPSAFLYTFLVAIAIVISCAAIGIALNKFDNAISNLEESTMQLGFELQLLKDDMDKMGNQMQDIKSMLERIEESFGLENDRV